MHSSDTLQGLSLIAVLQWPWVGAEFPGEGLYYLAGASCRKVTDWDSSEAAGGDKCSHTPGASLQDAKTLLRPWDSVLLMLNSLC